MKSFEDKVNSALDASVTWSIGLVLVGTVAILCSGCSGVEVGGKLGVYRVDQRQESQATHRQPIPLKCYITQCGPEEVQGS